MDVDNIDDASAGGNVRILKDPFHFMTQIVPPQLWPSISVYSRDLSEAIYMHVKEDYDNLCDALTARGDSIDTKMANQRDWVLRRVRRHIPPPDVLTPRLENFWAKWKNSEFNGQPVFTHSHKGIFKNMLGAARKGQLSDPCHVNLYLRDGWDDDLQLPLWRCIRGTNKNESLHNQLNECVVTENCSVQLADNIIAYKVFTHNRTCAVKHIPGTIDHGHFDTSLIDKINTLSEFIFGEPHYTGETNGDAYAAVGESTGVVKLCREDMSRVIVPPGQEPWKDYTGDLKYISERGGSLVPMLPVSTKAERELFATLRPIFVDGKLEASIKWKDFAAEWDKHVDGKTDNGIFRKSQSHLRQYFKLHGTQQARLANIREQRLDGFGPKDFRSTVAQPEYDHELSDSHVAGSDSDTSTEQGPSRVFVPAPALGNATQPQTSLTSTRPELYLARPKKPRADRTCYTCKAQGCAGANNREKCPQFSRGVDPPQTTQAVPTSTAAATRTQPGPYTFYPPGGLYYYPAPIPATQLPMPLVRPQQPQPRQTPQPATDQPSQGFRNICPSPSLGLAQQRPPASNIGTLTQPWKKSKTCAMCGVSGCPGAHSRARCTNMDTD